MKQQKNSVKEAVRINCLELSGICLGLTALKMVLDARKEPNSHTFSWTDSETSLNWILRSGAVGVRYLDDRIRFLRHTVAENNWRHSWNHVPGKDNRADIASRGRDAMTLINSELWLNGPSWLVSSEEQPKEFRSLLTNPEVENSPEIRAQEKNYALSENIAGKNFLYKLLDNAPTWSKPYFGTE